MTTALALTLLAASTLLLCNNGYSQDDILKVQGPYLGQTPPGLTPEVFAPGIISTKGWEYGAVFAPGMKELYWVREVYADTGLEQQFVVYEQKDNSWHERVIGERRGTPTLSTDGKTMFFGRSYKEWDSKGWSESKRLGPVFEDFRIMRVTESAKGTIVFDEAKEEGAGLIRYSQLIDGKRAAPKPLPKEINTGKYNVHPFIAPDESYIIWDGQRNSAKRNADLFISFRQPDGSWGEAIKFGNTINTEAGEFAAFVSPDGKYLFFNRNVGEFEWKSASGEVEMIPDVDIFWVDARIIESLKPKQ